MTGKTGRGEAYLLHEGEALSGPGRPPHSPLSRPAGIDVCDQEKHSDWVRDVAWAPCTGLPHNMIASGGEDGQVLVWTQVRRAGERAAAVLYLTVAVVEG